MNTTPDRTPTNKQICGACKHFRAVNSELLIVAMIPEIVKRGLSTAGISAEATTVGEMLLEKVASSDQILKVIPGIRVCFSGSEEPCDSSTLCPPDRQDLFQSNLEELRSGYVEYFSRMLATETSVNE